MEKEFIPYKQALALKELGFDRSCIGWYKSECSALSIGESWRSGKNSINAPLYSQAFRWFREKYNLLSTIYSNASGFAWEIHNNVGGTHRFQSEYSGDCEDSGMFTTYEKAELACLIKLIESYKKV